MITWSSYRRYCNALRDLLRMAEEDYYRYKLGSLCTNQTENWKVINGLMGNKSSTISKFFIINNDEIVTPMSLQTDLIHILLTTQEIYTIV